MDVLNMEKLWRSYELKMTPQATILANTEYIKMHDIHHYKSNKVM